MRSFGLLCCLGATLLVAGCACKPDPVASQPVPLRAQETSMWCWAASGEMCMDFLGTDVSQCDEANKRFGHTDCCTNPGNCVFGGWPEFDKYGFSFNRTNNTALTFAQLQDQVFCKHKPIAFSWHWPGGGGHMMVVYGYAAVGGQQFVFYRDPWPPNSGNGAAVISYANWVAQPGDHTHWDDFYDITKK